MTSNGTPHILVVEDDGDIREAVLEVLEDEGFTVTGTTDGAQAMAYLDGSTVSPDLILLDVMMPTMDGFQFRAEQRKNPRHAEIPVIVFTADGHAKAISAELGAAAVLLKPVKIGALVDVVRRVLTRRT